MEMQASIAHPPGQLQSPEKKTKEANLARLGKAKHPTKAKKGFLLTSS